MAAGIEFDIVVSYAGEDRSYVEEFVDAAGLLNISVWFDRQQRASLWGLDLVDEFSRVFSTQGKFVVMFISEHYAAKVWPNHERRSALARMVASQEVVVLPARFDSTELPGLPPSVGYEDASRTPPHELAQLVREKLDLIDAEEADDEGSEVVTETGDVEGMTVENEAIDDRDAGWEYLALAQDLRGGLDSLEDQWRDYVLGLRSPAVADPIAEHEIAAILSVRIRAASMIVDSINNVLGPELLEEAFGAPGEPGDRAVIRYVASRVVRLYRGLLDWAEEVRSIVAPDSCDELLMGLARFVDEPIRQVREFVDEYETGVRAAVDALRAGRDEPVTLSFTLELSIPPETSADYQAAMDRFIETMSA